MKASDENMPFHQSGHYASKGELWVFLGSAPGVGKTYAMLREGHRLRDEGHDVVVGFVETHGREETAAQIGKLEVVPRKKISYRSVIVEEMDVDAVLARAPEIVLVDELAHTNVAGSARAKRWQDVDKLRAVGINVITTLNIQHINELVDVVFGITGVQVRETIPYAVLESATDVQLIDLPVDDLLSRLDRGKIYPHGRAKQAMDHFFQPGNLAALRELALRWTAAGVEEDLTGMMLQGSRPAIDASERVAILMTEHARWGDVLRNAWRLASVLRTELDVLIIRSDGTDSVPGGSESIRIRSYRQLAEDLGATVVDVAAEEEPSRENQILRSLREQHTTVLVLGVMKIPGRWGRADRILDVDLAQRILLAMPQVDIHLVSMDS